MPKNIQFRNAKGQFVSITDKLGDKWTPENLKLLFPEITDLAVRKGIEELIRVLLSIFDFINTQKILSIHPYFRERL